MGAGDPGGEHLAELVPWRSLPSRPSSSALQGEIVDADSFGPAVGSILRPTTPAGDKATKTLALVILSCSTWAAASASSESGERVSYASKPRRNVGADPFRVCDGRCSPGGRPI